MSCNTPHIRRISLSLAATLFATASSQAVVNFIDHTWMGDGMDNPTVLNPNPSGSQTYERILGFRDGTLSIAPSTTPADTGLTQSRFVTPTGVDVAVSVLGGGSANLILRDQTNFDGGESKWDAIQFRGFSGNVTGLQITVTYTNPIAARGDQFSNSLSSGPLSSALGLVSPGSQIADFDVTMSYGGIRTAPDGMTAPTIGGTPVGLPITTAGFDGPFTAGQTSFQALNGFTGTVTPNENILMVKGWDSNGDNDLRDADEAARTYVGTQTWTIVPDAANPNGPGFQTDTYLTLSLDGAQFSNIPEPSSIFLALSGAALLMRRRR